MHTLQSSESGHGATGSVRAMLRAEGALVFLASTIAYAGMNESWWWFAGTFFAPDLAMAAYVGGATVGARVYNVAHSYLVPLLLAIVALSGGESRALLPAALVWGAHIGFDRALGYGLKYETAFTHTHLGRIGRAAKRAAAASELGGA